MSKESEDMSETKRLATMGDVDARIRAAFGKPERGAAGERHEFVCGGWTGPTTGTAYAPCGKRATDDGCRTDPECICAVEGCGRGASDEIHKTDCGGVEGHANAKDGRDACATQGGSPVHATTTNAQRSVAGVEPGPQSTSPASAAPESEAGRASQTHSLKCWPEFFAAIGNGTKTFEVRKTDRDFQEGDCLRLCEWSPEGGYTGNELLRAVDYVLRGPAFGIEAGYCVMSIRVYQSAAPTLPALPSEPRIDPYNITPWVDYARALRAIIESRDATIAERDAEIERLRHDRDYWRSQSSTRIRELAAEHARAEAAERETAQSRANAAEHQNAQVAWLAAWDAEWRAQEEGVHHAATCRLVNQLDGKVAALEAERDSLAARVKAYEDAAREPVAYEIRFNGKHSHYTAPERVNAILPQRGSQREDIPLYAAPLPPPDAVPRAEHEAAVAAAVASEREAVARTMGWQTSSPSTPWTRK